MIGDSAFSTLGPSDTLVTMCLTIFWSDMAQIPSR
jgi:hypothetical protein